MSASLVGSEMCIRDSGALSDWWAACRKRRWWTNPVAVFLSSAVRGWSAVSYTHLTLPTICSV
eukprot:10444297-Alexandrium_andersonii.AAC.1